MSRRIYKIFILSVLVIMMFHAKSFAAIGKDINKQITNWSSGGSDDMQGYYDEVKKQAYDKLLNYLKSDFQYTGNTINNEMKMKTTISIEEKKSSSEYTIRVRNRQ